MAVALRLAALVLIGLATPACTPVCDEAGLRRAAEALAGGPEQRQAGLDALREACPTIPPALAQGLGSGESARDAVDDPAWLALLARMCPAATHADGGTAVHDELDGMRDLCDLDRHGLLAPDDVFAPRDLFVSALFEWLTDGRVDRSLASEVARPLLTAHELATEGLTPPRAAIDTPVRRDFLEIRVSPTSLSVDGVAILALERGRPAPGAFVRHVSPALFSALAAAGRRAREQAGQTGRPWSAAVRLLADRATPFATITDVLFTASKAEYSTFQLVVHNGRELRGQWFSVPLAWNEVEEGFRDGSQFRFVVGVDEVVAQFGDGADEGARFTQPAGAALAELVTKAKGLFPSETVVTYRVDGEVSLQAVVSLMDTADGEGCRLADALRGGPIPDECLFWQPVLDREPPLHFAIGEPVGPAP
jgi:biopolymer transport protein ExbD